jgi:hypothetical protein
LHRAGVDPERDFLTYKDFEAIFSQMDDIRRPVGVHLRGVNMRINLEEFGRRGMGAFLHSEIIPFSPPAGHKV